jgi:hypothetical protein
MAVAPTDCALPVKAPNGRVNIPLGKAALRDDCGGAEATIGANEVEHLLHNVGIGGGRQRALDDALVTRQGDRKSCASCGDLIVNLAHFVALPLSMDSGMEAVIDL